VVTGHGGGTRREGGPGAHAGTRREGAPGPGAGTRREGVPGRHAGTRREEAGPADGAGGPGDGYGPGPNGRSGGGFTRGLPPALAARFTVLAELAAGAEADVVVAREVATARLLVIKLYRRGVVPDENAVGRLATADPAHVVEVVDRGWAGGCWFEVLEYCPHGSLRTLMDTGTPPSTADFIRETSSALAHVHGLGLVHRDLKPENILIRTVTPLDVVLGDFGLVRAVDASVRWTRAWGTPAYSPPEFEGGEVSTGWDWWSLGMIVAELAGGRHPFQLPDGSMMSDQQIRAALAQRAVDLSAVSDSRTRLLCQGLLTRDRRHRWGHQQVTDWLEGRSPKVVADAPAEAAGRVRRVFFAGQEFDRPASLAGGLQQHWADGMRQLYQERDATLVDELERMLRSYHLDEALRLINPGSRANELPRHYANLLAEMDPELEPDYNGVRLTPAGLEAAALDIISAGGDNQTARILDEVRRLDILISWRDLPGMEHGPAIQQRWAAADGELEALVKSLNSHGYQPTTADWAYARAWLLLCILAPSQHGGRLASLIENLDSGAADSQPWWRNLRRAPQPTAASLVLVRLTCPLATEQTHRQEEAEDARRQADRQRQADAEAQRRRQRQAERDGRLGRRRGVDRRLIYLAVFLIVTYGAPYGLGVWWFKQHSHPTVPPPPDLRALPGGATFVPQWVFGGLVILGLLGLLLMRPPWIGRVPRILTGLLLVAGALAAPAVANSMLTAFDRTGQRDYATGPIPLSAFNGTCDDYWTSNNPDDGAYLRWVLTDTENQGCGTLTAYRGWREVWHVAAASTGWWQNLHLYGSIAVAEKDTEGEPNVLDGFNASDGHLKWVFSCGDGNDSYLTNTSYGASDVTVTCARGQVNVNPRTGKATS
jgi:serine/threonine protein kinase